MGTCETLDSLHGVDSRECWNSGQYHISCFGHLRSIAFVFTYSFTSGRYQFLVLVTLPLLPIGRQSASFFPVKKQTNKQSFNFDYITGLFKNDNQKQVWKIDYIYIKIYVIISVKTNCLSSKIIFEFCLVSLNLRVTKFHSLH